MAPPRIAPEVKGRIISFLNLKWSTSVIIKELKKCKIRVSAGTICKLRQEIAGKVFAKPAKRVRKKMVGRPRRVNRSQLARLKNMVKNENPPTVRHMARKLGMSTTNVWYHIRKTFGLVVCRKGKVHSISNDKIARRHQRSWPFYTMLLKNQNNIVTTDEAWFRLSDCNGKRRICYKKTGQKGVRKCVERKTTFSNGFMVWAGISARGKTSLPFVNPGA
jgi:hypothetical protein